MAAQLRVLRRRIRSVKSTQKITRAMELIATARIAKAQARVEAARPYAEEITKVLSALATGASNLESPLLVERENPERAAVLVVTSDRGLAGGYNANVFRRAEELQRTLREEGKEPVLYVLGRKGVNYYRFREREVARSWTGFSEQPDYANASDVGRALVDSFLAGGDESAAESGGSSDEERPADLPPVDELHVVYTEFISMLTQRPVARRVAPLGIEYADDDAEPGDTGASSSGSGDSSSGDSSSGDSSSGDSSSGESGAGSSGAGDSERSSRTDLKPLYEFEPDAETLLGSLLPTYVRTRIFAALLEAAASESAARRRAMKAATDNAGDLIKGLTQEANQARQAQITQEISEIVGGANALAAAGSDE